jgi:hypothetical protein
MSDESFVNAAGESHDGVLPARAPNKDWTGSAEGWREGGRPTRTPESSTRIEHRVEKSGHGGLKVSVKQQRRIRDCDSLPCCIMSPKGCFGIAFTHYRGKLRQEWTK